MFDARPVATRRRFPAWFLALGLLLGLNLFALLYVLLRDERNATVAPVASSAVAAPAVAAPVPAVPAAVQPSAPSSAAPLTGRAATMGQPRRAVDTPAVASVTAPLTAPAPSVAPARTRDDLLAAGDAVPETQVSLHVYDADPGKRFVFLDGQRLREGDVAANGLRVERIDADGVVLDHRGSDFKVPLEP